MRYTYFVRPYVLFDLQDGLYHVHRILNVRCVPESVAGVCGLWVTRFRIDHICNHWKIVGVTDGCLLAAGVLFWFRVFDVVVCE